MEEATKWATKVEYRSDGFAWASVMIRGVEYQLRQLDAFTALEVERRYGENDSTQGAAVVAAALRLASHKVCRTDEEWTLAFEYLSTISTSTFGRLCEVVTALNDFAEGDEAGN